MRTTLRPTARPDRLAVAAVVVWCLAAAVVAGPGAAATPREPAAWEAEYTALRDQQRYQEAAAMLRSQIEVGDARAMALLGYHYSYGLGVQKDHAEAARWSHKAAAAGDTLAMHNLGWAYESGEGVRPDLTEAVRYYRSAAEGGQVESQARLGEMYLNGTGVDQDHAMAARWLLAAAPSGSPGVHTLIGYLYATGQGVVKDVAEAERWWRGAANAGNSLAQYNLGELYRTGAGVRQDLAEATRWYRLAAEQGHSQAVQALENLQRAGGVPRAATSPTAPPASPANPPGVYFAGTEKGKRPGWFQVTGELKNLATLSGALVQELPPGTPFAANQAPPPGQVVRSLGGAGWLLYVRVTSLSGFPQWGVDRVQVECYDPRGALVWNETATNRMGKAKRPIEKITRMITTKLSGRRGGPCLGPGR